MNEPSRFQRGLFYAPLDAYFNSLSKSIEVVGSKNDYFERYFNFNLVKLIVRKIT